MRQPEKRSCLGEIERRKNKSAEKGRKLMNNEICYVITSKEKKKEKKTPCNNMKLEWPRRAYN